MPKKICTFLNGSQSNAPLCNTMTCRVISWKTLQKSGNIKYFALETFKTNSKIFHDFLPILQFELEMILIICVYSQDAKHFLYVFE